MALLVGSAGIAWQAHVARQERDHARLEEMKVEKSNEFLQEMLASVDPAMNGPDGTVRQVLDRPDRRCAKTRLDGRVVNHRAVRESGPRSASRDCPRRAVCAIIRPMRICQVITRLIIGGAQENTILTCEGLFQRGHDVTLISGPTRGPEGSLVERVRSGGYRYIEIPELVRQVNPWLDARAQRYLRMEFERLRPDIVHTHSSKAGILGRLAAAQARVPRIVHTVHGMSFNRTQGWLTRRLFAWLERRACDRSHAVVAVADAMIEQCVAAGVCRRERMQTICSGMEVEQFDPALYDREAVRREWGVGADEIVVGTVARLFRRKGYEQLIPILARAAQRDARLRFVWVGDGAQRGAYEAELRRLGLGERTHLTGLVPPAEVPRLLAGFDILAHTSQWEGLPRVVVQALLMRVPAVAFDIDGTPEVVLDGRTGRLIGLNDEAAFVAALLELAADEERRRGMGEAGREHCLARFDWRTMVDELEALYLRLLRYRP